MQDMLVQVEPLIPALRRYARALVRNRATADDLVQDCLERAVSRWHQRRDGGVRAGCSRSCTTSRSTSSARRLRAAGTCRSRRQARTSSTEPPRRTSACLSGRPEQACKTPGRAAGRAAACCGRGPFLCRGRKGVERTGGDGDVAPVACARKTAAGDRRRSRRAE